MLIENLHEKSATNLIDLIKTKKTTVTEITTSIIHRIKEVNPQTKAFVHLNFSQSLETARQIDAKIDKNESVGPLFGIPVGVKDIFNTKDFPTEMGSPIWKGFTPGNDARVVHYVKINGGILIGKTETAEFAVHALGNSLNPFDPTRSPGTSSSGSAIAVATYMVPIALGTQTAGSIIRPASFCGVYGFKPSFGLIPRTGMLKTTDSLDQVGFFARTPADLTLFFDVIHVKGRNYPLSNNALNDEKRQSVSNRPWKIKFVKTHTWDKAENYAKKAIEDFVDKLTGEKQLEVSELSLSDEFSKAHDMHKTIYTKSLSYYFKNELQKKELVSKIFYEFSSHANNVSLSDFDSAITHQNRMTRSLDNYFSEGIDVILSLSTSSHAPLRTEQEIDDPSLIWTMCGVPAINVPAFKSNANLPFGLQIIARKYNDKLLLKFVNYLHQLNLITDGPYPKSKL